MDSQKIRELLGQLQENPLQPDCWAALSAGMRSTDGDLTSEKAGRLLSSARKQHAERQEWSAVCSLLKLESGLVAGTKDEVTLTMELARVFQHEMVDEGSAVEAFERLKSIDPQDPIVNAALEEHAERAAKWQMMAETYHSEAEGAPDDVYRASMLMRAAEMELRFAGAEMDSARVLERLNRASELDPSNEAALRMLENLHRVEGRPKELRDVLARWLANGEKETGRRAAGIRLARVARFLLNDADLVLDSYVKVLRLDPRNSEAIAHLSGVYSQAEAWDDLVALYEGALQGVDLRKQEALGDLLQVAMLHYRMRQDFAAAEKWFEHIRRLDPTNGGMLTFFREYCQREGDDGRLLGILQAAQRAMPEGDDKQRVAVEIARLSEGGKDAQGAIDQYRGILRRDPTNVESRVALKKLYRKTQGYNHLVEVLRQELEHISEQDTQARLAVLEEIAGVYRDHVKSDTALVSALNQILQVDPSNAQAVRELITLYEQLGRWRDLLANQQRLAELTPDPQEKAELLRAAGRRWLEQFSNVQNATSAFEGLLSVLPQDTEARSQLKELYKKRRAWPDLYALYESEAKSLEGAARATLLEEMAQIAGERLHQADKAISLMKEVLLLQPGNQEVSGALEKQAERSKDWVTLAEVLEQRAAAETDAQAKLAVLQKLGGVYAEQLEDADKAASAWQRVLDVEPGHGRALRVLRDTFLKAKQYDELEILFATQNDWSGLAEVLGGAADKAEVAEEAVALSYRTAAVYEQQLGAPERALRSYERILSVAPQDLRAAQALIPLYEAEGKWAKLTPLFELLAERAEDPQQKLGYIHQLSSLAGERLQDKAAAFRYAKQAYELDPEAPGALESLEQTARVAGEWASFAEVLAAGLGAADSRPQDLGAAEPSSKKKGKRKSKKQEAEAEAATSVNGASRVLRLKLAEVYATELGRVDDAITELKVLLTADATDEGAGEQLETLLRRENRREDLRWLLNLRVQTAPEDEQRVSLLSEWATLEETVFEDAGAARNIYQRIIEISPGRTNAMRGLPRLMLAAGEIAEAATLMESQRNMATPEDRAEMDLLLAELYVGPLKDPKAALVAARNAIEFGAHPRAVAVLRQLVEVEQTRGAAAALLADQFSHANDAREEAAAVAAMLSAESDPERRLELYSRLVEVHQLKQQLNSAALDVVLRAVVEFPKELSLWDKATGLATETGRMTELADAFREALRAKLDADLITELCRRAATLHEQFGDPVGATPYLQKILALDPANPDAFNRMKQVFTNAERWGELVRLFETTAAALDDSNQKVEVLSEAALVAEDILEDAAKATSYYEAILEIEPGHPTAVPALDRLYTSSERHEDLARLLVQRLELADADDALEFKTRLARTLLEKLHRPADAAAHVEDALLAAPGDHAARELAESLLDIGSQKVRAARMLEPVYAQRGEDRELVRVLKIRLDAITDDTESGTDERRLLLRRIAQLMDESLRDDEGALAALSAYVPLDTLDVDARARLLEIGTRLEKFTVLAGVLEEASKHCDSPTLRAEIISELARLYSAQLNDSKKAERAYRAVLEIDPADAEMALPPARALEGIYIASRNWKELAEMLRVQIALESSVDLRRELLGRLGVLSEQELDDVESAIGAWRTRWEEDPADVAAMEALDRLYERAQSWEKLVEVLQHRQEQTRDSAARRDLTRRLANVYSDRLQLKEEAIEAWRAIGEEGGLDQEVFSALKGLYSGAERWDELADTYESHIEVTADDARRLDLLTELGNLRENKLENSAGALEAYRAVLSGDPTHAVARESLRRLLTSQDVITRREAAEVLGPIYHGEGAFGPYLEVLEIEIAATEDPVSKLGNLERAARVAEERLEDPARALGYVRTAVKDAAGHADLRPWLEELNRLSQIVGERGKQVALLRSIVPEIFDGDVQLQVILDIARLARDALVDSDLALEYFGRALEAQADLMEAYEALEAIHEERKDWPELHRTLERHIEALDAEEDRRPLLFRRAELLTKKLNDPTGAAEVYQSILDIQLDAQAAAALEGLYVAQARWVDLVDLYQRQLDAAPDTAEFRVKIADVALKHLHEPARALDELEAALASDASNVEAVAALEGIVIPTSGADAEIRIRAAGLLEPIYLSRSDFDRAIEVLKEHANATADAVDRVELLKRLAQLFEEQKRDYKAALTTYAAILHEDIADEGVVAELERLAALANSGRQLAEIYATELDKLDGDEAATFRLAQRAGELYREQGEPERALKYFGRALAFEPENQPLFAAVDALLTQTGNAAARVAHYRAALETRYAAEERLPLLHVIASLQADQLGELEAAIATYREAVEVEPTDSTSLEALARLYRQEKRFDDLAELYQRRAELGANATEIAEFRLLLARLFSGELKSPERAVEQLEEIAAAVPSHAEAIAELESLRENEQLRGRVVEILRPIYEQADDWQRLVRLNEDRLTLATENGDRILVLRETGALWETRGKVLEKARDAFRQAVEIDADDADARADYERLVEATQAWDELAVTYEEVLECGTTLSDRREILAKVAEVHDVRRDDPRKALSAYDQLRQVDETELGPVEKMEEIATLLSDWQALVVALSAKAELVLDDEERASLWRRVGEAYRDMLESPEQATRAYEKALDLEPDSTFTMDNLIGLHEASANHTRLLELYDRRVDLTDAEDIDLKYSLLVSLAGLQEKQFDDNSSAISALTRALELKPHDGEVLRRLEALYRKEHLWHELLETLQMQADLSTNPAARLECKRGIAEIQARELENYEDALISYRSVLEEKPDDTASLVAVKQLGEKYEELRPRVTEILVPLLEASRAYPELVETLELQLTVQEDAEERAATLRRVADVHEQHLNDKPKALAVLLRSLADDPINDAVHDHIRVLADQVQGYEDYAAALSERAKTTFDAEHVAYLQTKLGLVAEFKLNDLDRAIAAHTTALEQVGDHVEPLKSLDRLYGKSGDHSAHLDALERLGALVSEAEQADLYAQMAQIHLKHFKVPGQALGCLRMALERVPDHAASIQVVEGMTEERDLFEEAAEILEQVYRQLGRTGALAALFEKRIRFADSPDERLRMRMDLARVLEQESGDQAAALRVLQLGLADDLTDGALIDEIERLAGATREWREPAQALLTAVAAATAVSTDLRVELTLRAARWYRDNVGDAMAVEAALQQGLSLSPNNEDVLLELEALQRSASGRELALADTLRKRAQSKTDTIEREALYREAHDLLRSVGESKGAEALTRELLAVDEASAWALAALTETSAARGDHAETFELLERRIELGAEPNGAQDLRLRAANLARRELKQNSKAISLFQELFDNDPTEQETSNALKELYVAEERWQEYSALLERLVDVADSPAVRGDLRMELTRLNMDRFKSLDTAVELLRTVLEEEPSRAEAVVTLSKLLEETGRDEELAELLNSQISAAQDRSDINAELQFRVRLGEVYESRLGDRARAAEAYKGVVERDPSNRAALLALVQLYKSMDKPADSAAVLERVVALAEPAEVLPLALELSAQYRAAGDLAGAGRSLLRAREADRTNKAVLKELRELYVQTEDWSGLVTLIVDVARDASATDEKVNLLREAARLSLEKRSDAGAAASLLEEASALSPEDRDLLMDLCDAYSQSGRGKDAVAALQKVVESFGGRRTKELADIHRRLAKAYLADGNFELAQAELDKAFRIQPGNVAVLQELGDVAIKNQDYKKAQQMYRALLLQKLDDAGSISKAEVFYHLGRVHHYLDETAKAIQMLERAIQTDASLMEAKQLLEQLKG